MHHILLRTAAAASASKNGTATRSSGTNVEGATDGPDHDRGRVLDDVIRSATRSRTRSGKLLESIFGASGDPNPESLPMGGSTADKPVVANWHTSEDTIPCPV
jgi:hypothetical protein